MIELTVHARNRLKAVMADMGFRSMRELSEETGIHPNTLYGFETGKTEITLSNLLKLLYVLDCSLEDLVEYEITSSESDRWEDLPDSVKKAFQETEAEHTAKQAGNKRSDRPHETRQSARRETVTRHRHSRQQPPTKTGQEPSSKKRKSR